MWIEKLVDGVLRVLTPLGPRYIKPSFRQRLYLMWLFRHFELLPLQVLNRRQRDLINALCADPRAVYQANTNGIDDMPILGTVERRPPVEAQPLASDGRAQAAAAGAQSGIAHGLRQRS